MARDEVACGSDCRGSCCEVLWRAVDCCAMTLSFMCLLYNYYERSSYEIAVESTNAAKLIDAD
jgi:hypothetical protein